MANRLKGEASFTLDGEEMTLLFDAEAFLEIEDRTGRSVFAIMTEGGEVKLGTMAQVLSVGLQRHHGDVSRVDAADMLLAVPDTQQALLTALEAAMPSAEGNVKAPTKANRAKAGTGKTS